MNRLIVNNPHLWVQTTLFNIAVNIILKNSKATTYADDTETATTGETLNEVKKMMQDAENVLRFMASNGLIANPKKTAMLFLNLKKAERGKEDIISIKIGKDQVNEVKSAKLLGITLTKDQTWNEQICGTGGVISCLNQRFYLLKRLKNKLNQKTSSL